MDLLPLCPSGPPIASQLAEALVAFLEAALHQVLCVRRVYPAATFRRVRRFGQLSWWSQSAALSAYLRDVCNSLKEVLQRQLLHRLLLVLLDEDDHECERYIFEFTPLLTQPTVALNSSPLGWSGRAENKHFLIAAAPASSVDFSKRSSVRLSAESSSSCSSSTSTSITGVAGSTSGLTCSRTLTCGSTNYSSGSTPVSSRSSFEGAGGGSRAWRRLCAAFQDVLTKLELVGCWLDADDTDEQADEDSEEVCFDETSEILSGTAEKSTNGTHDQAVASCRARAISSTAACLPLSASVRSPSSSLSVKVSFPRSDLTDAAQRSGGAAATPRSEVPQDTPAAARPASGGTCTARPLRTTGATGTHGRVHSRRGCFSSLYKERRHRLPARAFRVQLQQDAEVLDSLDATAAAVPRPLSCLDEDLRAMLLLRSRWLPSRRDSSWGLHGIEVQQSPLRCSFAAALLSVPPSGQQRSTSSTSSRNLKSSHGSCTHSRNKNSVSFNGLGGDSRSNNADGVPLFDSFVLASVPRSTIFASEPHSCFGRAPSPVLPGGQPFGRSGAALLRIIVQQPRGGPRSLNGQHQREKRSFSLSRRTTQNVTPTPAAATNKAAVADAPYKRTKKAAKECQSPNTALRGSTRKLLQRVPDEAKSDGERQQARDELEREWQEEKQRRPEQIQQEVALQSHVGQQLSTKTNEVPQEAEKLRNVRSDLTGQLEKYGSNVLRSRIEREQVGTPVKAHDLPPSSLSTTLVDAVDAASASFVNSLHVGEATASVVAAVRKSSVSEAECSATEDRLSSDCREEDETALLYDAQLDSLF